MTPLTKNARVLIWFAGKQRTATASRQLPGGLWWCTFPKPIEGSTGTTATRAALGDADPHPSPTQQPQEVASPTNHGQVIAPTL